MILRYQIIFLRPLLALCLYWCSGTCTDYASLLAMYQLASGTNAIVLRTTVFVYSTRTTGTFIASHLPRSLTNVQKDAILSKIVIGF